MRATDIRVHDVAVGFREVRLDTPLTLSSGAIDSFTVAQVHLEVVDRAGGRASGYGESVLSVPWAWPRSVLPLEARDGVLRGLVEHYARRAAGLDLADPIAHWYRLTADLEQVLTGATAAAHAEPVPALAGLLTVGAVDNALHDAWARAAGRSAFAMYTDAFLSGPAVAGWTAPAQDHVLRTEPLARLQVQHVVGVSDPLTGPASGTDLVAWIRADGVSRLKIKVAGADPASDARRISEVYRTALGAGTAPHLTVDPNEGYAGPGDAVAMLDELVANDPAAAAAIDYLEQPTPRDLPADPDAMRRLSARVPVLMDEEFSALARLDRLRDQGWSGVVVKASKGQSPAVLAATRAHRLGLRIEVQDLTQTGPGLVHSARLAAHLRQALRQLEYNSRQYAPAANEALAVRLPALVRPARGEIALDGLSAVGLLGLDPDGGR